MVYPANDFRMIDKISKGILYLLVAGPLTVAAFAVSPYMGVPFAFVLILGGFRKDNT